MSRAFVKEDVQQAEDLPDRIISLYPNDVTREGLKHLEEMLNASRDAHVSALASQDQAVIAHASRELRYWNARYHSAQVVPDPADCSEVRFGSSVTIRRADGRQQTFRIVGEDEADPSRGTLSHAAPLARALFGKHVGDIAELGGAEVEVRAIQ